MNKKTLLAIAAVAVLGAIYAAGELWPETKEELTWTIPALKDRADKIVIVREGETTTLEKREGTWRLTSPVEFAAAKSPVDGVLDLFAEPVGVDLKFPVNEDELPRYELGKDKAIGLSFFAGAEKLTDFLVGKAVGKRTYVKPADELVVYRAKASIRFKVDKKTADWRNKTVFDFEREDAVRIVLHHASGPVTLERNVKAEAAKKEGEEKKEEGGKEEVEYADTWRITTPFAQPADKSTVSSLLGSIVNMRAAEFADDVAVADAGFTPESFRVTVHLKPGKGDPQTVVYGATVGEDRLEAKYKDDYFAMREGVDSVYVVRKYTFNNTRKELSELRAKKVFPDLKREHVTGLKIESGGHTLVFAKEGDDWKAKEPADLADALDESPLNSLLSSLASLRAARVLDRVDDATGGFLPAERKGRLTISRKDGKPDLVLLVGKLADEGKKEWYVRREDSPTPVWVLRDYVVRSMTKSPDGFRKD